MSEQVQAAMTSHDAALVLNVRWECVIAATRDGRLPRLVKGRREARMQGVVLRSNHGGDPALWLYDDDCLAEFVKRDRGRHNDLLDDLRCYQPWMAKANEDTEIALWLLSIVIRGEVGVRELALMLPDICGSAQDLARMWQPIAAQAKRTYTHAYRRQTP